MRLFAERMDSLADPLDPGFGFDMIRLAVPRLEALGASQLKLEGGAVQDAAIDELADRLATRLGREIGRAHVGTPVTNAHLVCRLLLAQKNTLAHCYPTYT